MYAISGCHIGHTVDFQQLFIAISHCDHPIIIVIILKYLYLGKNIVKRALSLYLVKLYMYLDKNLTIRTPIMMDWLFILQNIWNILRIFQTIQLVCNPKMSHFNFGVSTLFSWKPKLEALAYTSNTHVWHNVQSLHVTVAIRCRPTFMLKAIV